MSVNRSPDDGDVDKRTVTHGHSPMCGLWS